MLRLLEIASRSFSRIDCNLLKAEKTLEFIILKLSELKSQSRLATKMLHFIKLRFEERRSYLSHSLMYLDTGKLNVISEKDVINALERLVRRLYKFNPNESNLSECSNDQLSNGSDIESQLNEFINKSSKEADKMNDLQKLLRDELKCFKQSSQRGKFLEFCYKHMIQIKVSSIDVESVFSSLGIVINTMRTRLNDSTIDNYLFLKFFLEI